ncbi:Retrovirus-related Pol polyprotein from transposon RE2 [Vitis vinifera]|uniref:Retrovirus-related Pol polyprotein from transposon RE2 n=1 Tax=Vitis vinifera TaxID=29760 RepID=A0A438K998_VITVI|nr:Retrovirus-related Pol polyprotein from transposon RE2 [Vitis vinifera]
MLVLSVAVSNGWILRQLDVNNVFLQGTLTEHVYMTQPPGFIDQDSPSHVCKLKKAIYGLKQAPRAWYQELRYFLLQFGFTNSHADTSLFVLKFRGHLVYFLVYVDDLIITGDDEHLVNRYIHLLANRFSLKDLGKLSYFLGVELFPIRKASCFLNVDTYLIFLLELTCLRQNQFKLLFHQVQKSHCIQGINYLILRNFERLCTRPQLSTGHLLSVYFVIFVVLLIIAFSFIVILLYPYMHSLMPYMPTLMLIGAGDPDDFSSTAAELNWVSSLLCDLGIQLPTCPVIYCDNVGATQVCSNPVFHSRMKHVAFDFHFIRDQVQKGILRVAHVSSTDQLADLLTKSLPRARFLFLRDKIGLSCRAPS